MNKILNVFIAILIFLYPFLIFFGLNYLSPRFIALIIGFLFVLRFLLLKNTHSSKAFPRWFLIGLILIGLVISILGLSFNSHLFLMLYPVLINLLFLIVFLYSLIYPPTIIERFATLTHKKAFPKEALNYMKKITITWIIFFSLNGLIALYTVFFTSVKIWSLYNGFISYILIGLLFLIELLIRKKVQRKLAQRDLKHG